MQSKLRFPQLDVKQFVAPDANDCMWPGAVQLRMARPTRTQSQQKIRLHFIPEWAEKRGYTQADIVRGTGVDKANVSRWFGGSVPRDEHIEAVTKFLGLEDPRDLFRHPEDDWFARFVRDRGEEERERIRRTLEAAFPKRQA